MFSPPQVVGGFLSVSPLSCPLFILAASNNQVSCGFSDSNHKASYQGPYLLGETKGCQVQSIPFSLGERKMETKYTSLLGLP